MNKPNDLTRFVNELAGHWTDPTLEILKGAGIQQISVDMEVEAWQTLKKILHSELRWQCAFRSSTLVSLTALMEQVLRQAALFTARKIVPQIASTELEKRIRSAVSGRRATESERKLYAELVRQPALHAAFKPPTRTDYFPRLRVTVTA
jgi:hypothetical protein